MSAPKEPLSYEEMEKMSARELVERLKAERLHYGNLETHIAELRDYCTMVDICIGQLADHNEEKWTSDTVSIVIESEQFDALTTASILAKTASRALYDQYLKPDASAG
jgi:hypothetical protein